MTHAEVIDLVSSSPSDRSEGGCFSKFNPGAGLDLLGSPKPKQVEKNDGWLDVSDFSDTETFGSKRDNAISPKQGAPANNWLDNGDSEGENSDNGYWFVDDDDSYDGRFVLGPTTAKPVSSILNGPKNCTTDKDADFWDLTQEFDCTTSRHSSIGLCLEPVRKKQRFTPELESGNTANAAISKGDNIAKTGLDISGLSGSSSAGVRRENEVGSRASKKILIQDQPILSPFPLRESGLGKGEEEKLRQKTGTEIDDDVPNFYAESSFRKIESRIATSHSNITNSSTICVRGRKCEDVSGSASSDSDLPDISNIRSKPPSSTVATRAQKAARKKQVSGNSGKTTEQKAAEKARKAQEQLEVKEAKERKRLEREEKAQKKQAAAELAKVNMLRTDKKVSTPEMIVDLPLGINGGLATQVRRFLGALDVECTEWRSPVPNVIKWRRKVDARFNEDLGCWEPTKKYIEPEKHMLCIILAQELVDLVTGDNDCNLDTHASRMKASFGNSTIIYLIEGLTPWIRKNRNVKNKEFVDAVRSQVPGEGIVSASSSRRQKKKQDKYVDEEVVEDALLRLQVIHGALIHHTSSTLETAEWVMIFTQHISTIPYRLQRMNLDTAFCMEVGQVKTGENVSDTYVKMLQEVTRITAPIAYGIAHVYPSVHKLVSGFEKDGKDMLQSVRKSANRDGAYTDREVGKRISQRLYNIFMGMDEESTDV